MVIVRFGSLRRNSKKLFIRVSRRTLLYLSMVSASDAAAALDLLTSARRVVCICHRNPDGDAAGSLTGMGLLIERNIPGVTMEMYCTDPVPATFHFLPAVQRVNDGVLRIAEDDCVVFLDCAEPKLTELQGSHPELFTGERPVLNIDHHPTNTRFGMVNIVQPEAASACEIVVQLADRWGWMLDSDTATALLTGVYTDTGGLLHSNTGAEVYRTVARLLRAGARQQLIVTAVFRTASISTLKLWGRVLENISVTEEGGAISAVTEGDFRATGAEYSELAGAIDYVNAVPGMRFSMVLSERGGTVKGSIRTLRDDVDVSAMAGKLKGGGHKKAAGFAVSGKLKPELRWKVVEESNDDPTAPRIRGASDA